LSLVNELKRRNVFRVGTAYLALGWVILQVTSTVVPYMRLPEWTVPMVLWIGAIGFPCVLIFSWVYELTPEGIKRESEVDRTQSITGETSRKLDYLIVALLAAAITLAIVGPGRGGAPQPAATATEPASATPATADGVPAAPAAAPAVSSQSASSTRAPVAADDKSIAVLPFTDMSAAKDQEYMSDGISEELLNLLAKIPELRVIARTSSFAYKGKDVKLAEVARELNVAHILEGSVRTSGNRVRITAQLIRASDSTHLWSETYDRTLDDIFAVQDEIATAVVNQLKITLLGNAPKAHATDPKAYALLLKSRQASREGTLSATARAAELVEQALTIDPRYAEAWVDLSAIRHGEASNGARPIDEGFRLAKEAVQHALELDPRLGVAHARLAAIAWEYDRDAAAAAEHIARAIELDPANLGTLLAASNIALGLGRLDVSRALCRFAVERDPVNPRFQSQVGYTNLYSGLYDAAIESYRNTLALSPQRQGAHFFIGASLLLKGNPDAAIVEFETEPGNVWRSIGLTLGYHAAGRQAEADAVLRVLETSEADSWAYNLAYVHAMRGNADKAFEWLDRAVRSRDPGLSDVAVDPLFGKIHDDPRWLPFLRSIGRAPEQLAAIPFDVKLP
jgi:TolB-like protein/Tfp pilus assembly protein PilF